MSIWCRGDRMKCFHFRVQWQGRKPTLCFSLGLSTWGLTHLTIPREVSDALQPHLTSDESDTAFVSLKFIKRNYFKVISILKGNVTNGTDNRSVTVKKQTC